MASRRPNQQKRWHDPLVYAAAASATSAVRTLGPGLTRPALAALGGAFGRLPMNTKRIERAAGNIAWCFPELDPVEAKQLAHRSYRHLFLIAAESCLSPRRYELTQWPEWIETGNVAEGVRAILSGPSILVTGHCGNWELLGSWLAGLGVPLHALYRPLDNLSLDAWVRRTRARLGVHLVDKFGATATLPDVLQRGEPVGFIADQNAGERGIFTPFFDRLASSYKTIGLLAMRHEAPVVCGMAMRLGGVDSVNPMRFRIEITDVISPDDWAGRPDPLFYITARYRRAIERMVRAAPEQYLWMHRAWKTRPRFELAGASPPTSLMSKLESLPWMTEDSLRRILTPPPALADDNRALPRSPGRTPRRASDSI